MQAPKPRTERDPRLDVFRGLALITIFINHTPGTIFENWTTRNFGFSDAAEGFVLMSGIAAGMAYGKYFAGAGPYWAGVSKIWRRVWTLYQVHIVTTVIALGIAAVTARYFGGFEMMQKNVIHVLYRDPLGFLIGVPLLTHQLGYANILPLYSVLLFVAPATLWAGYRWPYRVLGFAILLWLAAAILYFNFPNYPNRGGWFFNPFSWQLLFTLGLLTGLAMREGRRFVPVRPWLVVICAAWLIFALLAARVQVVSDAFGHTLFLITEYLHLPWLFTAFDKTFLSVPRLSHALALAYVLSVWPAVRTACASRFAAPFALLGRHGLAVFGLGVVLCYAANGIKTVAPPSAVLDVVLIFGGIGLMLAFAWSKEAWRRAEIRAAA